MSSIDGIGGELSLIAQAVGDERQLDGRRHLELVGESSADVRATLSLIVTRDGEVEEADLALDTRRGEWLTPDIDDGAVEQLEPLEVALHGDEVEVSLAQREDGDFDLRLRGAAL